MERVVDCPICGDKDHCFEDMQDDYSAFMCFNCGFMSNTNYTGDHIQNADTSKLINDLRTLDEDRQIWWYPCVLNMGPLGMVYPEGDTKNWEWKYAKVIEIDDKDGTYGDHTHRLDVTNAKGHDKLEFINIIKDMGITKRIDGSD